MLLTLRRVVARLHLHSRNLTSKRLSSTSTSGAALDSVSPLFTQTPPLWVRFAWPLIIGNALLLTSAIDITWSHWSTLVNDLEAVAERNREKAAAAAVEVQRNEGQSDISAASSSSTFQEAEIQEDQSNTPIVEPSSSSSSSSSTPISPSSTKADTPTSHWERRPTWQRAGFCSVYVAGWAFSTAYLLKYRQTYITRVKFFRGPSSSNALSSPSSIPTPPPTRSISGSNTTPTTAITPEKRFIYIETASQPKGMTIPLDKLSIYEGRNETELVIRSNSPNSKKSRWNRTGREYWFMSLSGAIVDGTRFTQVERARDKIVQAWFGDVDGKKRKKGEKKSSLILS